MMGKTHAAAGGLFAAAAVPPLTNAIGLDYSTPELVIGVGIGVVAGLLPDIDHPDSMLTAGVVPGASKLGPLGRPLGWLLSIPPRIIGVGARATMNHRGGTHSALFMALWTILAAPIYALFAIVLAFLLSVILGAIATFLPVVPDFNPGSVAKWIIEVLPHFLPLIMFSVFFGYLSHLVTDSMTNVPIPWPWPFSKKRFFLLPRPLRITTDSAKEKLFVRPLIILLLVFFFVINIVLPAVTSASKVVQKEILNNEPKKEKVQQEKQTQKKQAEKKRANKKQAKKKKQATKKKPAKKQP